jgi:HlyD family secretion protein
MKRLLLPLSGLALSAILTQPLSAQEGLPTLDDAFKGNEPIKLDGTLVPSKADEVVLWPQEWTGGYRVLEVLPHGTMVERGQVIAVLDREGLEKQLHDAEMAQESAQLNFALDQERAELDQMTTRQGILQAEYSLNRAKRDLKGWHEFQTKMNKAQAQLSALYGAHGIEDATDELDQLEAMYTADELTDATEEIVLKRSRRNLERSKISLDLQERQRDYQANFSWTTTGEMKEEALQNAKEGLELKVRRAELDNVAREHRLDVARLKLQRQEHKLERLREDMESMEIRAPRSGMLLHGAVDDYGPGKVAPRHRRGGQLQSRTPVFAVAAPGHFEIQFKAPESELVNLRSCGEGVATISGLADDKARVAGSLELAHFPIPSSASGPTNQYLSSLRIGVELTDVVPGQRASIEFQPAKD